MPRKSRKNVGVIGLGIIGSRVALALRASGYHVYVWSRTPRVVPNFLASAAEVAEVCEIIQIFVSDAQALFEVLDGFIDHLTARHTVICSATVGPEATVEAAKIVQERGARFLDAPFTGSKVAAEKRELVYYIGGDEATLRHAEPTLRASGNSIVKVGEIGHAATLKVATNMLAAVTVQALAEALAIVKRSGISGDTLVDAIENHGVRSGLSDMKLRKMVHGDFDPHFSMKNMFKDVQLAIHVANSVDIDIPATTATAGVMYGGLNRGWAELDFSALAKIYATEEEAQEKAEGSAEKPEPPTVEAAQPAAEVKSPKPPPVEPATSEPPKESVEHMKSPPPREELHASLHQNHPIETSAPAAGETKPLDNPAPPSPATTANSPESKEAAASKAEPSAEPIKPTPRQTNPIRRWFAPRDPGAGS